MYVCVCLGNGIIISLCCRLFKLTDEDLLHFRILSVGHRKELLVHTTCCDVAGYPGNH